MVRDYKKWIIVTVIALEQKISSDKKHKYTPLLGTKRFWHIICDGRKNIFFFATFRFFPPFSSFSLQRLCGKKEQNGAKNRNFKQKNSFFATIRCHMPKLFCAKEWSIHTYLDR